MKEISYKQFQILRVIEKNKKKLSQRDIAKECDLSLGTANKIITELLDNKYIDENNLITEKGLKALSPYRVKRAIFLAAGFGSRMMPITLNTPKPLVRVHGKRLIESLIEAVIEAEIEEIIIVTGYLKEQFKELEEKYPNVKLLYNEVYNETNNISSAYCAREYFPSSYILESDLLLYNENLINKYEYYSNYLGRYVDKTDDWCLNTKKGIVTELKQGGTNCHHLYGIAYFNKEDGTKLTKYMKEVFENTPGGKDKFWDMVALDYYKDEFKMRVRECEKDDIVEIDSFTELKIIDPCYDI